MSALIILLVVAIGALYYYIVHSKKEDAPTNTGTPVETVTDKPEDTPSGN